MRLRKGFEIVKTQSFEPIGGSLVATAVDEAHRTVIEFNHKPALEAYAETLGVPQAEAVARFFEHSLGLMVEGEPFVRSPQRADGANIVFYCQIKEGMELEVLHTTDIVADTRRVIEQRKAVPGEIQGVIDFNCILRTLQLRNENRCDQYGAIFNGHPDGGFQHLRRGLLGPPQPDFHHSFVSLMETRKMHIEKLQINPGPPCVGRCGLGMRLDHAAACAGHRLGGRDGGLCHALAYTAASPARGIGHPLVAYHN